MSHQDLAAIWSTLQGRLDIEHIVLELIGHYYLDVLRYRSDRGRLRSSAFQHIVALRAIFDLQRTYLQSSELSFQSKASLLPPEILFSTIVHLLEVKASAFCTDDALADHAEYLSFIGQTLLSGLRALLLQTKSIPRNEFEQFLQRFEEVWACETLCDADHFSIQLFCRRILVELSDESESKVYSIPACGMAHLQDFYGGLYPLRDQGDDLADVLRNASRELKNSTDWFHNALVIYDIFWSTLAAQIQLCMDVQNKKHSNQWSSSDEATRLNDVHFLLTPQFKMLDHLYTNVNPRSSQGTPQWAFEQTRNIICMGIHPPCFGLECNCFCDERPNVQELWLHRGGQEILSNMHAYLPTHLLDTHTILQSIRYKLTARTEMLPGINQELKTISRKLADFTREWCGEPSLRATDSRERAANPEAVYIINCPELHPYLAKDLPPQMNDQSLRSLRHTGLPSDDTHPLKGLHSTLSCSKCSSRTGKMPARKIEPLSRLSDYIQERMKRERNLVRKKVDGVSKRSNMLTLPLYSSSSAANSLVKTYSLQDEQLMPAGEIKCLSSEMRSLPPASEKKYLRAGHSDKIPMEFGLSPRTLQSGGVNSRSPSLRKAPSIAATCLSSSSSNYLGQSSYASSRTFSPSPLPSQADCTNLPEVVQPGRIKNSRPMSVLSDGTSSVSSKSRLSSRNLERKSKWSFFRSNRSTTSSSIPASTFFTSGRALLIWNDLGAGCYDLDTIPSASFRIVTTGEVLMAAGGTRKCATVSKNGSNLMLRIFQGKNQTPLHELELEQVPFKMALSGNDHHLALKFGNYVRILDTLNGTFFHHKLPVQNGRSGPNDHLVAFSTDGLSFIASTRFEPEKVISYFSNCQDTSHGSSIESSAPYGLVGDDGLSSVVYSGRSAFITTFTEKGYPTHLSLSELNSSSRPLRDKNQQIGSRIHRAVLCPTGQNLVFMNDRNDVFWLANPFGKEQVPSRVGSIKRTRSVKREVELAMPSSDEVHVFWIEKGRGILVTMGRFGGKSKPTDINLDMDQLFEV